MDWASFEMSLFEQTYKYLSLWSVQMTPVALYWVEHLLGLLL